MQSFLSSRPVLKSDKAPTTGEPEPGFQPLYTPGRKESLDKPEAAGIAAGPLSEPRIEVVNGDGRINRIIVTCTCCKRIELDCEY